MIETMNAISCISKDICWTCLSHFNDTNAKCSLINCLDSNRLELLKNVMSACSLTLLDSKGNQLSSNPSICRSCVVEINQMLSFLQKCIQSEASLKQLTELKTESSVLVDKTQEKYGSLIQSEFEIKVEDKSDFDLDDSLCSKKSEERSKHKCQECKKMFSSALLLTFHKFTLHKFHICHSCQENFRTLQLFKEHMATKHRNPFYKPYFCRQCPDMFISKDLLTVHERRMHNTKKYSCGVCKRTFLTISSLKFHENIHLRQRSYSCTSCLKSFTSSAMLKDHKSIHSENNQFKCHCGKSFNRKKKLESHVETVHEKKSKAKNHPCPECDKKFHHPYSLKNHINTHLGIKPFLCSVCGSAFTSQSNLTSHFKRVHSGEKQPAIKKYLCHKCGDPFARASHLQRHTLRKHVPNAEKKHECPICKKKFLEKSDVAGHIKLHDDVKPFVCDQCSKRFRTAWRLQAHINRVHLGLRPFECPTCSLKFKTKSHLEKHIRTHTGEKPFPCPHCAYTCAEKSNLKKHINIHLKGM